MLVDKEALNRLLPGFLQGDPQAACAFDRVAKPMLSGLARRFGPELPADLVDEVVSETYLIVLGTAGRRFDPSCGSAYQFLFGIARNALQRVRARYCPPGVQTRRRKRGESPVQDQVVPFDEEIHSVNRSRLLPDAAYLEAILDLGTLLKGAATVVAAALVAVHVRGEKPGNVARRLAVSRFRIHREFRALQERAAELPAGQGCGHP